MATIKKGTYRFNDVVTGFPTGNSLQITLDFTVKGTPMFDSGSPQFDPNSIGAYSEITASPNGQINYASDAVYTKTYGWNNSYEYCRALGFAMPELKGFGQVITVTNDTETEDESAEWFHSNTKVVVGSTSYNDINIANFCVGQTVTIKCKGKVMKDDIVITL